MITQNPLAAKRLGLDHKPFQFRLCNKDISPGIHHWESSRLALTPFRKFTPIENHLFHVYME